MQYIRPDFSLVTTELCHRYVEELLERIETLKKAQDRQQRQKSSGRIDPISPSSSSPEAAYHGVGSVIKYGLSLSITPLRNTGT
jgi:hypothetical protein